MCLFVVFFVWPLNCLSFELRSPLWYLETFLMVVITCIYYRYLQDAYHCVGTKLDKCSDGVHLYRDVQLLGSRYICNEHRGGKIYAHYFELYLLHSKLRILNIVRIYYTQLITEIILILSEQCI